MKTSSLPFFILLSLLSFPHLALANEGPAWVYFVMAPFALFTIPFFLTGAFAAVAAYCYWWYRATKKKSHGIIAVLMLLLVIPAAVRDKQAYVVAKLDHEHREHVQLMAKQRREARRAGKHVSPDFTAISTANTAKYMESAKTETDRLNFQASRDMLQMQRAIDAMQQKEPLPASPPEEDKPPVRSGKTILFELYAVVILAITVLAGAAADRWRRRRNWAPLLHLVPLFVCIYAPVFAQLPFMDTLMGMNGPQVYLSRFSLLAFTPLAYFAAYGAGILLWSLRVARTKVPPAEPPRHHKPAPEKTVQVESPEQSVADGLTHFACPECKLAGKIADARLPEQGVMATCPRCKTRFPVRRIHSGMQNDGGVASDVVGYTTAGVESKADDEVTQAVTPRKKFTFKWKKVLLGLAALLLIDWLGQTMLLNMLIVLGSNAGAKFTLLAPQALLPFTMPTRVSFIDKITGKPLAGKQVRVTWEYHPMGILPETEARYADLVYTTDANGKIWLPCRLKPPRTYLMAFFHSFNQGIFLYLNDPGYIPASETPYLQPRIQGERLAETIAYASCRTEKDWQYALERASRFTYTYLKEAIDGVVRQIPLNTISDLQLQQFSEYCDALVTPASQQIDEEVVRRGPQRMYTESYIRTLIRLGRDKEAIATLPLLAGRPHAEEWQKYFRKFVDDLAFERSMAKEAAPLIASGKSGARLHEEALALHKQKKYRECLPYYHAAITLSPESGRFTGNYACAVNVEHEFFGEKLSRRAIPLDRNRGHSYLMLADVLLASNRNVGAYLLAKEALRLGWKDTYTWSKIALAADRLYEKKEAEAAAREALRIDPNNPDLQRFRHLEN